MSKRAATPFGEKKEPFVYGPWKFISEKSHILNSDEIERYWKSIVFYFLFKLETPPKFWYNVWYESGIL